MAGPSSVMPFLKTAYEILKVIPERVKLVKLNKDQENKIAKKIHMIQSLLEELKPLQDKWGVLESFTLVLEDLDQEMKRFEPQHNRAEFLSNPINCSIDLMGSKDHCSHLESIEKGLDKAITMLQTTVGVTGVKVSVKMHSDLKEMMEFQNNTTVYGIKDPNIQPPNAVKDFSVELQEKADRLMLSWRNGSKSDNAVIEKYEIEVCNDRGHKKCFTTRYQFAAINDLQPGKRYSFKVRAIGKGGTGKWSPENMMYFRTAVPTKPQKPEIIVEGTREILVLVTRPSEKECNGADISHGIVECIPDDGNSTEWQSFVCPIEQQNSFAKDKIEMRIKSLEEGTKYEVRVKFQNTAGNSPPSEKVMIQTNEPIPGPPVDFRVSSKRTANTIKVRWSQPHLNPSFAHCYKVEMRTKRGQWEHVKYSEKLSAEATELHQDTKYYFRVQSLNRNGDCSNFTEVIEAETRFSIYSKAALSPFVFIGSTIASPFLSAIGMGVGSGILAAHSVNNPSIFSNSQLSDEDFENMIERDKTKGEIAAGVAAGIAGGLGGGIVGTGLAPVIGGAMTHAFMHYGEDYSDQSDDDEKET